MNLSKAALKLHTSQPAISKQIQLLEQELGVDIFLRNGKRSIQITPAGQLIVKTAREMLGDAEYLKKIAQEFNVGYTARVEGVTLSDGEQRKLDMRLSLANAQLETVVISGGRFEQRVGEVTQSLSVLKPDIVLNKNIVSMDQALDQVPGVVIIDEEPQIRAGKRLQLWRGQPR